MMFTSLVVERSTTAVVGAPATINAASIFPSLRSDALSPNDWYVGTISFYVIP